MRSYLISYRFDSAILITSDYNVPSRLHYQCPHIHMPSTTALDCFTSYSASTDNIARPEKFTFPFYYQPHLLSQLAVSELQQRLLSNESWQPNLENDNEKALKSGKMFGVLVVESKQGKLGYLSAFSGKLSDKTDIKGFVPPVFDAFAPTCFYQQGQKQVNAMNARIICLENESHKRLLEQTLQALSTSFSQQEQQLRSIIIANRKSRKVAREKTKLLDDALKCQQVFQQLAKDSVKDKNELLALKADFGEKLASIKQQLAIYLDEIEMLKAQRKTQSYALQQKLFEHYQFLNIKNELKDLKTVFSENTDLTPPAGSGDCAAPKLLQYAFKHQLKPIAMAEFWWGKAPKSEIRQHKNYYPSCQGKCKPILAHMLKGLDVDENPLLKNPAYGKPLPIIYQDEYMLIVNKPAEFLSVPGKTINDSVYTRIKNQFPDATGGIIVHRLDMSTSGLMVIALTARAHKQLQKQFINRTIKKRYVALLNTKLGQESGEITLPLRGDLNDRPRQLVCFEHGKNAETKWQQVPEEKTLGQDQTKIYLYPKTGRTHQLRVHCAHPLGLNTPIIGDDLYGVTANRLHLHAEKIELNHPISRQPMSFQVDAEF